MLSCTNNVQTVQTALWDSEAYLPLPMLLHYALCSLHSCVRVEGAAALHGLCKGQVAKGKALQQHPQAEHVTSWRDK